MSGSRIEGIAIVGMSARFPGAADLDEYWRNLCGGVESITSFSREELEEAGVSPLLLNEPRYVRASGVIEGFESFDAAFFDFNPAEARIVDPHHRLFLEHAWQALENAGYDPFSYGGSIGVFGGMGAPLYLANHLAANPEVARTVSTFQLRILNDKDFLASLTAYKLNLQGPCASVQTACSTSLVAAAFACQSLLNHQCDMALAGGVALSLPGRSGYVAHEGIFSPDGRCRAFDAEANGTVSGRGVGVVVLKRLAEALEDGDHVHAVIRGWAMNNDGALKAGYTAPSVDGQAEVVAMAQAMAGVDAETISYVEAHGTGTPLGDQIEVAALSEVFRETTQRSGFCALGSVKTNIGHLDIAAGVAGLLKVVLALEHRFLPPSLHFSTPNPHVDFAATPFYVQSEGREWQGAGAAPRRAGVSSFAMGGVNAHLVLEEAPPPEPSGASRPHQLLVWSARTPSALATMTARLAEHLSGAAGPASSPEALADVAHTLRLGRRPFEHRRALVCRCGDDVPALLRGEHPSRLLTGRPRPEGATVAFLFPGLGNHYVGMARELYDEEAVFRDQIDRCAELLEPRLGLDFRTVLYPPEIARSTPKSDFARLIGRSAEGDGGAAGELLRTRLAQPVLFAVEYALSRLLVEWGLRPAAMLGFSIGEYVAACLAGVVDLEDGLALVADRAEMIDRLPAGAMLAVSISEAEVEALLTPDLSITAVNAPRVTVVGGAPDAVADLARRLEERGDVARRLETTHAFHSPMMSPVVAAFRQRVARANLRAPRIPFVSNVTGTWITAGQATDPGYWADHLCRPVRFAAGVAQLGADAARALVEVGPGQVLSSWALQAPASDGVERLAVPTLRHAFDRHSDQAYLLDALARLWIAGVVVDWPSFAAGERRRRVPLPTYPFERKRFWIEARSRLDTAVPNEALATLAKTALDDWFYLPAWKPEPPALTAPATPGPRRTWVLFIEEAGFGLRLAERLEDEGHTVVLVAAGERFAKVEPGAFTLEPGEPGGYSDLLTDLRAEGHEIDRIVHLWTLGPAAPEPERDLDLGLYSLIFLAQALAAGRPPQALGLWVLSSHLFQVTGHDEVHPEKATILGPCAVIPQEFPGIECRCLELALPPPESRLEEHLLDAVRRELDDMGGISPVAYRGSRRWRRDFERVDVPVPGAAGEARSLLKSQGVYLITGGLGGLGLVMAEELARSVQARLVLVTRSAFPPASAWDGHVAGNPPSDPVSRRIRRIRACQELGAEVLVAAADVTDVEAMEQLRAEVRRRFGAVDGILHAAGVFPGGFLEITTRARMAEVLAPKVQGTRVLERVFAAERPDFLLLCSSLTAITGSFSLTDHTAANSFLDAFAQSAALVGGTRVMSVNWDAWQEVGQAVAAAASFGLIGEPEEILYAPDHPLLGECVYDSGERIVYRTKLTTADFWVLDEHRFTDGGVMPGTGYLEMVRAACAERLGDAEWELRQVYFLQPMVVPDAGQRWAHLTLERRDDGFAFHVDSRSAELGSEPVRHVEGRAVRRTASPIPAVDVEAIRRECSELDEAAAASADRRSGSFLFGPHWTTTSKQLRWGDSQGLLTITLAEELAAEIGVYGLHPALLDGATGFVQRRAEGLYLPYGYERLRPLRPLPRSFYSHARLRALTDEILTTDLTLLDLEGEVLVEIEGYTLRRVDPAAIGAAGATQDIGAALAHTHERAGEREEELLAAIRPREGAEVLRRLLGLYRLPPQMLISTRHLPTRLRALAEQTPSRHFDRIDQLRSQAGANHPRPDLATAMVAPRTDLEDRMASIWRDLLGLSEVGVHDNFFDLGGDSLLATRLVAFTEQHFAVRPSLRTIFEAPTIAELAAAVTELGSEDGGDTAGEIERRDGPGPFPLSFNQRQIWLFERLRPGTPTYNVPTVLRLSGRLRIDDLQSALDALTRRQDELRATFHLAGDAPAQTISDDLRCLVREVDLSALARDGREREAHRQVRAELARPFDLERGPLVRVLLLRLEGDEHVLAITLHHLVCDRFSQILFVRELVALYRARLEGRPALLPELTFRYVEYAVWQDRWMTAERVDRQLAYWKDQLTGAPAALELPADYPRSALRSFRGARHTVAFADGLGNRLKSRADAEEATLFMALLAGFYLLLYRHTGQEDLLVGSPITGRNALGTQELIGLFAAVMVLRTRLDGDPTLGQLLRRVREVALGGYAHQDLPLERLVAELDLPRDPTRAPLFQVMFIVQRDPDEPMELPGLVLKPWESARGTSKYDLTVFVFEQADGVRGAAFEYRPDLFTETRIAALARDFERCLELIAGEPELRSSSAVDRLRQESRRELASRERRRKPVPTAVAAGSRREPAPETCDMEVRN